MKLINFLKENYLISIILFAGAVLRVYHIDYQSLWIDEIYTINFSNPNYSIFEVYNIQTTTDIAAPPLYFVMLNLAFKIFGYTTLVMRIFTACFGIAGIFAIYLLGTEILNKKVGIYASILLSINYFHLYYSQEARTYSFYFFFTTFSFYFLIRFIKIPTLKSSFIYGISTALLLYGHFFAMFTLFSQYLILLYVLIMSVKIERTKFFFYCLLSGIITIILFVPINYTALSKLNSLDHFWAPKPELDVYTKLFKEFFGDSEIVLFFVTLLILTFFVQLFKEKELEKFRINPYKDKFIFGFLILLTAILVTLLIPLIRSYISVPMLISRYFIGILPVIIVIVSIGLFYVRSEIVRVFILFSILIFSLNDIIIVKKYYTKLSKSQIREASAALLIKNINNEPVVSDLAWFLPFYLNNEKVKTTIIESSLDDYVRNMEKDSTKKKPFWYFESRSLPLEISKKTNEYLTENFIIGDDNNFYHAFYRHYFLISDSTELQFESKFNPLKQINGDKFNYYIDVFEVNADKLKLGGYAFFHDQDASETIIQTVLVKDEKLIKIYSRYERRDDVSTYFNSKYDIGNSGFKTEFLTAKLTPGKYQLGLILKNSKTKKEGLILCDNYYTKE